MREERERVQEVHYSIFYILVELGPEHYHTKRNSLYSLPSFSWGCPCTLSLSYPSTRFLYKRERLFFVRRGGDHEVITCCIVYILILMVYFLEM